MPRLVFYRQKRFDGGFRMGVELNEETILEQFEPGKNEPDPLLLWFVDVRCKGSDVPADAVASPQWLLSTGSIISEGLTRFADHLRRVGVDIDGDTLQWSEFPDDNDGVERKIVCSASRRFNAVEIAEIVDDIRDHWSDRIEAMIANPAELVSRD